MCVIIRLLWREARARREFNVLILWFLISFHSWWAMRGSKLFGAPKVNHHRCFYYCARVILFTWPTSTLTHAAQPCRFLYCVLLFIIFCSECVHHIHQTSGSQSRRRTRLRWFGRRPRKDRALVDPLLQVLHWMARSVNSDTKCLNSRWLEKSWSCEGDFINETATMWTRASIMTERQHLAQMCQETRISNLVPIQRKKSFLMQQRGKKNVEMGALPTS